MSKLVDRLVLELKVLALPAPTLEHRFAAPKRQWRFDLCWPDRMIAVEVEGGIFSRNPGRHNRGAAFEADAEKYNTGTLMGWRILRFGPKGIRSGYAISTIARALKNSGQTAND